MNNNKQSKIKLSQEQSQAVIWLRNQSQWTLVLDLLRNRLEDAQNRLEQADEKNFRFEQGRVLELNNFLELEETAKAVLNKALTPNVLSVVD